VRRDEYSGEGDDKKYIGNSKKQMQYTRTLYSAPGAKERLANKRNTRILVEAEKSVLAIEAWVRRTGRTDIVPLGMGGCNGWGDRQLGVLPDLGTCCDGSPVIVMLDANVYTNKAVHEALLALVAELRPRGCTVTVAFLPQAEGVNGPDDLFTLPDGDEQFAEVLHTAKGTEIAPYSEHGLADRFAAEHRDDACYVPGIGWHRWDGQRWQHDEQGKVELLVQKLCVTAASERAKQNEQHRLRSRKTREAVMRESQAQLAIHFDLLDRDPMLLNTPGGTVDLRTGELRPSDRAAYCTKITTVAPSKEKPVRWLKFIEEITVRDKLLADYLQRVCGYCLTGDTREHGLFFLYGSGANGKGTFTRALQNILGEYAAVIPNDMLMAKQNEAHPTEIASLRGARMATAGEVEDGARWAESKLKSITGGDRIKARFMRQDFFEFYPQFKLVIHGNHKPKLRNVGEAIKRRLHLVPFNATFEKTKDGLLDEKLKAEYSGILQWCIDGCVAWQREGLNRPTAVNDATEAYLEGQDTLGEFLEAYTRNDGNGKVMPGELYSRYKLWAEARGEFVLSQTVFTPKMEERGYHRKKLHGVRYIAGLRWLTPDEEKKRKETEAEAMKPAKY
jgi:putative DNA primase/helicase